MNKYIELLRRVLAAENAMVTAHDPVPILEEMKLDAACREHCDVMCEADLFLSETAERPQNASDLAAALFLRIVVALDRASFRMWQVEQGSIALAREFWNSATQSDEEVRQDVQEELAMIQYAQRAACVIAARWLGLYDVQGEA